MALTDLDTAELDVQGTPLLVTVNEAARRLSIGRSTIYELIKEAALETVHIRRSCRITVDSLDAYVARLREEATMVRRAAGRADRQ